MKQFNKKEVFSGALLTLVLGIAFSLIGIINVVSFVSSVRSNHIVATYNQTGPFFIVLGAACFTLFSICMSAYDLGEMLSGDTEVRYRRILTCLSIASFLVIYPSLFLANSYAVKHGYSYNEAESTYNYIFETRLYRREG